MTNPASPTGLPPLPVFRPPSIDSPNNPRISIRQPIGPRPPPQSGRAAPDPDPHSIPLPPSLPPPHQPTARRPRTDSFFGVDPPSAPHSPAPSLPISSASSAHPSPNVRSRPSSFYGLEPPHHPPSPSNSLPSDSLRQRAANRGSSRLSAFQPNTAIENTLTPPAPLLDHSHLKPGTKAKLLNHAKTLELYRANARKTNDAEVMFEFGCFLMDLVKEMNLDEEEELSNETDSGPREPPRRRSTFDPLSTNSNSSNSGGLHKNMEREKEKAALTQEAVGMLQKLANRGHVQSQFLLADCYTKGMGTAGAARPVSVALPIAPNEGPQAGRASKQDYERAFPLFVLAAKHGHVEAMFRAGQCCEHGWGTRKERDKALQFYRKAAIAQHPLAMYRLGLADLNGELGQARRPKDGVKWLKRAAELADAANPKALHELALLHERGLEHVVFVDFDYAVELLARAAELGYAPSAYKLGEAYEYGRMGCPQDSALSIHYYNIAAQQNHKEACFALTAWYLVGSTGVLPQSDTEAYLWAKKAAEAGLSKAEYAVGYFTEVGIGTNRDEREALGWFKRAAEHGDKRAKERMKTVIGGGGGNGMAVEESSGGRKREPDRRRSVGGPGPGAGAGADKKAKEDCVVM